MAEQTIQIYLVEDNTDLREEITFQLQNNDINVTAVSSAQELDFLLEETLCDIVILDIGLPGEDGLSISKRLHKHHPQMGIIILTARGGIDIRLEGLDSGADCFLVKPIDLRELLAQIQALFRRMKVVELEAPYRPWVLKAGGRELFSPTGELITLTHQEASIMRVLIDNEGQTVGRQELMNELIGSEESLFDPHRLEVAISRLRTKISATLVSESPAETQPTHPLKTVRGLGYIFTASAKTE